MLLINGLIDQSASVFELFLCRHGLRRFLYLVLVSFGSSLIISLTVYPLFISTDTFSLSCD